MDIWRQSNNHKCIILSTPPTYILEKSFSPSMVTRAYSACHEVLLKNYHLLAVFESLFGTLIFISMVSKFSWRNQYKILFVGLKSRPCEKFLADFCTKLKFARGISHGFNLRWKLQLACFRLHFPKWLASAGTVLIIWAHLN